VPPIAGRYYLHDRLFEYDRFGVFFPGIGKNALFIYLLSEVAAILLLATHLYKWIFDHLSGFPACTQVPCFFAGWFMLMCWLTSYMLNKRKIYIRV
jgi:predicted acyltransferase